MTSERLGVFDISDVYELTGLPSLSALSYRVHPTFLLIAVSVSLSTSFLGSARGFVGYF